MVKTFRIFFPGLWNVWYFIVTCSHPTAVAPQNFLPSHCNLLSIGPLPQPSLNLALPWFGNPHLTLTF
jgi:hypothetical protein